jgi:ABC-type tungstate transport system substrate-binding protein
VRASNSSDVTEGREGRTSAWRRWLPWLLAPAFYLVLTIVQTWPLTTHLSSVLPNDLGDPLLNAWIIWWNAHAVPLTSTWWNGPIFWPSPGSFAFSETLLGLTPITAPIQWMGGSAITAYNVAFLLTFVLSAVAAHGLVFSLTGRHEVAVIGGLVFGLHPFRVAHFPQIQVMTSYWMPLALLGLHQYVMQKKAVWIWISAVAWLMQALSNGYYLLFFPVLVCLWLLWFALSRRTIRTLAAIIGAWAVASIPLIPLLWQYRRIHTAYGFQRGIGEVNLFGADLVSLLDASPLLKFWNLRAFHQPEGELFPGLTAPVLVLAAITGWLWSSKPAARTSRTCLSLLLASLLFIGIALSAVLHGPWVLTMGKVTVLSVRVVSKPLSIGVLLFLIALAFEPRFSSAWRRRSPLMFYVLATAVMYLLCLGPQPHFLGETFMYRAPYGWLMNLPGYDTIRVPARFAMLAALCLAVSAALGFARLTARRRGTIRTALAAVVAFGVLADGWIGRMPLPELPVRLRALESLPQGTAVMELPLGDTSSDVVAMYRGMHHGRAVVNGYSGFFPRSYDALRGGLAARNPRMFDAIATWGPVVVAVDQREDPRGEWTRQLAERPGTVLLGEEAGRKLFALKGDPHVPDFERASRLPIAAVSANVQNDRIALALDGNPTTRWDSGPQSGSEVVTIDLGAPRLVDGLSMTIGEHLTDSPRVLVIETSIDGRQWTTHWKGPTDIVAFAGVVRNPRDVPLAFALPQVSTRLVRLRQLGQDPVFYWSIYELAVFGPSSSKSLRD